MTNTMRLEVRLEESGFGWPQMNIEVFINDVSSGTRIIGRGTTLNVTEFPVSVDRVEILYVRVPPMGEETGEESPAKADKTDSQS